MNTEYLEAARVKVPNIPLLINLVSRRVKQLNLGERPLIKPDNPHQENLDIALKEVANGLLDAEVILEDDTAGEKDAADFLTL
jgi:DNA-directed RNA polymerase subunit omega